MNHNDPLVEKEAKQHKKFMESFEINQGSYKVANSNYFLVNYYRWNKGNGCAVVSPNSEASKSEYLKAFNVLLEKSELTILILTHGGERANVEMHGFVKIQEFLSNVLNNVYEHLAPEDMKAFEYCLERINLILKLQNRLKNIYDAFYNKEAKFFDGELEYFTRKDLDEAADTLGEIGYIQYKQLVANYESISKLKYIKELNNPEIGRYINNVVRRYLEEFSINEERQLKRIEGISYQPNMNKLTKEGHIEVEKEMFYDSLSKLNSSLKKDLRYPK